MRKIIVAPFTLITVAILALVSLAGVAGTLAQQGTPIADLEGPPEDIIQVSILNSANQEVGIAQFSEAGDSVTVTIEATKLAPGDHGIHIHETGLCEPLGETPYESSGGHYNPTDTTHGGPPDMTSATPGAAVEGTPEPLSGHAGDLGNITVGPNGAGSLVVTTNRFTLSPGEMSLFDQDGSSIVVHGGPDDLMTDPAGGSGTRVACGVIAPALEGGTPAASPAAAGDTAEANAVSVLLTEFTIDMPAEIPAGPTTFEISNAGTIEHSFEIEGQGIEEELEQNLQPGETQTLELDLAPGTYEIYCPVDEHADKGMEMELTVTG